MKPFLKIVFALLFTTSISSADDNKIAELTRSLSREILSKGQAYSNLKEFTSIGPRLSGTLAADRAAEWGKSKLSSYNLDRVWLQHVSVPHWTRGHEEAKIIQGGNEILHVAALGSSVGTSKDGVQGDVVEVGSIEEAARKCSVLKDKIVFFNGAMDPTIIDTFDAYGEAIPQRIFGAATGGKCGAIAVLVRSLSLSHDQHPHAGIMKYDDAIPKIPGATIATADADHLSSLLKKNPVKIKIVLGAKTLPNVESSNVIGELKGSEYPDQIIVVGGHLDSWDLGPGAHDDGAGVVQSLEVLRAIKALGFKPKRTIRVVLFMTEEFGGFGGAEYAKQANLNKEKHIAALESDAGGFTPYGFQVTANKDVLKKIDSWKPILAYLNSDTIKEVKGAGTDIEPLAPLGTAQFGLLVNSARYFDYHHTAIDTFDKINARELHLGAAAMAILVALISEQGF